MRRILDGTTPRTLVLLDEGGAGTDPTEGSALGMAVLRRLAGSARFTMCTTHHGSLKALKYTDARFENACVEFDAEKLAPTYRLLWGIPGRSNAIAIARRLGLQADVVADAASLMSEGDQDAAELIEAMQAQQEAQVRYPPTPLPHPLPSGCDRGLVWAEWVGYPSHSIGVQPSGDFK